MSWRVSSNSRPTCLIAHQCSNLPYLKMLHLTSINREAFTSDGKDRRLYIAQQFDPQQVSHVAAYYMQQPVAYVLTAERAILIMYHSVICHKYHQWTFAFNYAIEGPIEINFGQRKVPSYKSKRSCCWPNIHLNSQVIFRV